MFYEWSLYTSSLCFVPLTFNNENNTYFPRKYLRMIHATSRHILSPASYLQNHTLGSLWYWKTVFNLVCALFPQSKSNCKYAGHFISLEILATFFFLIVEYDHSSLMFSVHLVFSKSANNDNYEPVLHICLLVIPQNMLKGRGHAHFRKKKRLKEVKYLIQRHYAS